MVKPPEVGVVSRASSSVDGFTTVATFWAEMASSDGFLQALR
jgi:hypothetical protein